MRLLPCIHQYMPAVWKTDLRNFTMMRAACISFFNFPRPSIYTFYFGKCNAEPTPRRYRNGRYFDIHAPYPTISTYIVQHFSELRVTIGLETAGTGRSARKVHEYVDSLAGTFGTSHPGITAVCLDGSIDIFSKEIGLHREYLGRKLRHFSVVAMGWWHRCQFDHYSFYSP